MFLAFIIVLQQFDGNILGPAILGDRLGLSGFWILFAILVFGSLWGVAGMIIGAPLFAVAYGILRSLVLHLLQLRHQEARIQAYSERFAEKEKPPKEREKMPAKARR